MGSFPFGRPSPWGREVLPQDSTKSENLGRLKEWPGFFELIVFVVSD